jgi:glycosyltransferase involved in cell wall biosynthesis
MIPTYNCADLLRETLGSVLAQDPGPEHMQIEVVDDCSPADDPSAVVAELGRGRVGYHRHPANVGIAANFTSCLDRSRGELVHVLHGDDIVYPGFYDAADALLDDFPTAGGAVVGSQDIDEVGDVVVTNRAFRSSRGLLDEFEEEIFKWNPLRAPAVLARRDAFEAIGGYRDGLRFCADWDMWKRLFRHTPMAYDPAVLVGYRVHGRSDTARLGPSVGQLREMIDSVLIGHDYVPDRRTRAWTRLFYGRTRRWAWAMLRRHPAGMSAKDGAEYVRIVAESILRQQSDRAMATMVRREQR